MKKFKEILKNYPNFYLAGTIVPWFDYTKKKNWMLKGKCGTSSLKNMDDFKPLIRELLNTYYYVWIYAAMGAQYNPYNLSIYKIVNKRLNEVLK